MNKIKITTLLLTLIFCKTNAWIAYNLSNEPIKVMEGKMVGAEPDYTKLELGPRKKRLKIEGSNTFKLLIPESATLQFCDIVIFLSSNNYKIFRDNHTKLSVLLKQLYKNETDEYSEIRNKIIEARLVLQKNINSTEYSKIITFQGETANLLNEALTPLKYKYAKLKDEIIDGVIQNIIKQEFPNFYNKSETANEINIDSNLGAGAGAGN